MSGGRRGGGGAGRGRGRGGRGPRIADFDTVADVLAAHHEHGHRFGAAEIAASWNKLGKLVRRPAERRSLGRDATPLLAPLAEQTLQAVPKLPARALANTVHGVASVQARVWWQAGAALWRAMAARGVQVADEASPQELSNTAWAYATAGHAAPALFDAIAAASVARVGDFKPQNLSNTAWAYATAGHAAPALFDAIAAASVARVGDFKPQELSNTAWALAVADVSADDLFGSPLFVDRCAAHEHAFARAERRQLHQWQLWRDERGGAWPPLPRTLSKRCRAAFVAEEGKPSRLQSEVANTLDAMGLSPRQEVRTPMGYSLDATVDVEGCEVAVEVDGPSHFVGRVPNGATALKRRQLRAAGWTLLSVPYWEWNDLGRDDLARRAYLTRALRAVLPPDRS